jgi:hypothetical protein
LDRWLDFFPPSQIIIVDGEGLREKPVETMNALITQLDLPNSINFTEKLKFDTKKGFYCPVTSNGGTKCLGRGKGRSYAPMSDDLRKFLNAKFNPANSALLNFLKRYKFPIPIWLSRLEI